MSQAFGGMGAYGNELYASYSAVEARREWELGRIKEKLTQNEKVDTAVCRVERVSATSSILRFGLKRGKLLYLFKYPDHDVEREKHRNVITRARFIKNALEAEGYRLIPWDFKKGQPPTFWEEREGGTMEEEDDDLYGPSEPKVEATTEAKDESGSEGGDEPMDEESAEDDDEEDSDSDSDIEIIIDKPQTAIPTAKSAPQESKAIKIEAPPPPPSTTTSTTKHAPIVLQLGSVPGTAYPAVRTSTIDVDADPIYPPAGKTITSLDIDADLAEATKPWRLPGADQSDYFNYGFDEFTWEMYRTRQAQMAQGLEMQKNEVAQFQQMFMPGMAPPGAAPSGGGGGGGQGGQGGANAGVPNAPTGPGGGAGGMPGMPGMPGMNEEQMQMMMAQMAGQGMDVSSMDFNTFFQMASGGMPPGMGGGGGGQQQQAGYGTGGGGQGGGGGGGRGGGGRRGGRNW